MTPENPSAGPGPAEPIVTLMAESFALRSSESGADFRIWVARPLQPPPGEGHAVLFLFDARAYFAGVTEITRLMSLSQEIPPLLVVGLGYDAPDFQAQVARRTFDLTLTAESAFGRPHGEQPGYRAGGAPALFRFMERELKPAIAERYGANVGRSVLAGHSLGGLATLHEALVRPEQYDAYLVSSPAIQADHAAITTALAQSAQRKSSTRLYVSAGELETDPIGTIAEHTRRLGAELDKPGFARIDHRVRILPFETHATALYAGLTDGLRWLLRDWPADSTFDLTAFSPSAS